VVERASLKLGASTRRSIFSGWGLRSPHRSPAGGPPLPLRGKGRLGVDAALRERMHARLLGG